MDASTVVAVVAAVIALGSMAVGISQAVAAHRSAGEAADQVAAAREQADAAVRSALAAEAALSEARRQSDASERAAVAAERANDLAQASIVAPTVEWELTHSDQHTYQLKNVGTAPAFDVDLVPLDEGVNAIDVPVCMKLPPGGALTVIFVVTMEATDRMVHVSWWNSLEDRDMSEPEHLTLALPAPARRSGKAW